MLLDKRKPVFLFRLGSGLLAVALVSGHYLQNRTLVPESIGDPASGFLFGLAIGTGLLAVVAMRRNKHRPRRIGEDS